MNNELSDITFKRLRKILPEEGASTVVLFMMLCTSLISLATVFWAKQLENGTSSTS